MALKNGDKELTNNFNLAFTVDANSNVVSGKIAPATTAKATLKLDLTGTEVAVDYVATITKADLSTFFGASASNVTVNVTDGTVTETDTEYKATGTVDLVGDAAFTSANGIKTVEISLTWNNTDTTNASDTETGVTAGTLTFPVTVTLQQHI